MEYLIFNLIITIAFDNVQYNPDLETSWGFSCLIETSGNVILFDTGNNGSLLERNLKALGKDISSIKVIVLSHEHGDHIGGLEYILSRSRDVTVYYPTAFSSAFKSRFSGAKMIGITDKPKEILPGIFSTGTLDTKAIPEQALIIKTEKGPILITGCAHPGIVRIVERAKKITEEPLYFVMGGFHLIQKNETDIRKIAHDLKKLGVKKILPVHCTGDKGREIIKEIFKSDYVEGGLGYIFKLSE